MTLPKNLRITSAREFNKVKKYGALYSCDLFVLNLLKIPSSSDLSRFGFIITNKVSKRAVERHRLKRLFSALVKQNLARFKTGYLAVFVVRGLCVGKSYEEVSSEFDKVLSKVSIT